MLLLLADDDVEETTERDRPLESCSRDVVGGLNMRGDVGGGCAR